MKDPMLDKDFLAKLDAQKEHDIYAKVISLTFDENPIEEITGRVTGGSINVDGASAVRRTCSVNLVAQDVNINNFYWGLNTKFKLLIGIKNYVDSSYPDIIWFKQGTYVITSFNTSLNASSYSISIQGKDKMCLLNGDVGGSIESVSADFGKYDQIDEDGNIVTKDFLLKDSILEAVHHYGKEPFHNIIIQDLDEDGLELMEYRGDADLFFFFSKETTDMSNMKFDDAEDDENYLTYKLVSPLSDSKSGTTFTSVSLRNPPTSFQFDNRITAIDLSEQNINDATEIYGDDGKVYTVAKITYGDTCGYRLTDLTFAGDLILSTGDKLTSALDKIVSMLGEYEYFYNLDGQFVFRKKHTYQNTSWNTIKSGDSDEDTYVDNSAYSSAYTYSFTDSNLVSAFSNNPNLQNLRNDFSIWGKKDNDSATQFHLRYAIDKKPLYYKNYNGHIYLTQAEFDRKNAEAQNSDFESNVTIVKGGSKFRINKLIDGLSEDWWEIGDWTRRYLFFADVDSENTIDYYVNLSDTDLVNIIKSSADAVKAGTASQFQSYVAILYNNSLGSFATEWPPYIDWLTICPQPDTNYTRSSAVYASLREGKAFWTFLIDILIDSDTELPYIAYRSHGATFTNSSDILPNSKVGSGCGHRFYYAINEKANGMSDYTYIYKPQIPESAKMNSSYITIKEEDTYLADSEIITTNYSICDWREIIYQMAIDYYKYGHNDDFNAALAQNNSYYYPTGYTGYEQYYTDMQGFWRYIYNPDLSPVELTEKNIDTLIPDEDTYKYYVWDKDNQVFNTYTFNEATDIKAVPTKTNFYYTHGTIKLSDILTQVNDGTAKKGDKSLVRKVTDDNQDIYYCYVTTDGDTIYHWMQDDIYQVYKKYYNYSDSTNYYDYGLALDLTDLSQTKPYFYQKYTYTPVTITEEQYAPNKYYFYDSGNKKYVLCQDENYNSTSGYYYTIESQYILGDTIFLEDEFTYVGKVSEEVFNNSRHNLFTKCSGDIYTIATKWTSTTEYYKQVTPTNFNQFGTKYYEYQGYAESSSLAPGNTYYIKNTEESNIYQPCIGVLGEENCFVQKTMNNAQAFAAQPCYLKATTDRYILSQDDFSSSQSYYVKDDNTDTYSSIILYDPNPLTRDYYIASLEDQYNLIPIGTGYQANTTYYRQTFSEVNLSTTSYEKDIYYTIKNYEQCWPNASNTNHKYSVKDHFTRKDKYTRVTIDSTKFNAGDEQYYIQNAEYKKSSVYSSANTYYILQYAYPEAAVLESTWKKKTYYVLNQSTSEYQLDEGSSFDYSQVYHTRKESYTMVPGLTQSQFSGGNPVISTSTTYFIYKDGAYKKATGSYSATEIYFTREPNYVQIALISTSYSKGKFYILTNGQYNISNDKFKEGQIYWKKTWAYKNATPSETEYNNKTQQVTSSVTNYYVKSEDYDEAPSTYSSTTDYYIKEYDYTLTSNWPLKDGTDYYERVFEKCSDESYDSNKKYFKLCYVKQTVKKDNTYLWSSELYTKSQITNYIATRDTSNLKITYYLDNAGTTPINIYREKKYYIKGASAVSFNVAYTYVAAQKFNYYVKIIPTFKKSGEDTEGFFGDGIHTFYLKTGDKYVKQNEYCSADKDLYYVLEEYKSNLTIPALSDGENYYDVNGAIATNFVRGVSYYAEDPTIHKGIEPAFTFDKNQTYYIYVGYVEVKSTEKLTNGTSYLKYGTLNIQSSNYKFYPTNIYYGYTKGTLWDNYDNEVEEGDTTSTKYKNTAEHEYYIKDGDNYKKEMILHHFQRGKTYYTHEEDYDVLDATSIRMELLSHVYYKDDKDKYINAFDSVSTIVNKYGSFSSDALSEIESTTGLTLTPITTTSAQVSGVDTTKTYYIYECGMRPYNYLKYNISPLPALVYDTDQFNPDTYWTFDIDTPENLIFWFDFMDSSTGSELAQYGANFIGNRPKSVNDENVKAIYYRDIPNVIFIDSETVDDVNDPTQLKRKSGYAYMSLTDNIDNLFAISAQGKTAYDVLDTYLYQYSYCTESVNLTTIPVYYLEPNTRIFVYDAKSGINGEYLISKLTIPLAYNGTMSIQATKAVDRIY